ncbi:monocarboxylate transporter 13-like, partial [Acanthaster planci]|uniref:Monocarboxylate transporter 13-like n=1 Tax=Acanthaster planci TaxID=133434 RepID=A0A8B7ZXI1_ACAPL
MASSSRAPTRVTESPNSPEGGWGIVVVIATFSVNVLLFGLLRCGGILYVSWMNEFDTSARETAAVQSIATSLLCLCGLVGAILCKRFGCRIAGITGGVLSSLGLFCSFWAKSVLHLYVTFFIIGFGVGISYNFGMVAVAMHFDKKYKTANAVAFSGIGTGIMVAPPIFQLLLDRYGWRGTLLIISAIMANSIACAALFRPRRRIESPVVEQLNDDDGQEELEIVEEVPERQASASNADGREVIISETILDGERSSFDSGLHEERDEACYTSTDQTGRTDYMPLKDSRG